MTPKTLNPAEQTTVQMTLYDIDAMTQSSTDQIVAICRSGQARLSPDRFALEDCYTLFETLKGLAEILCDSVNSAAESSGCNYIDNDRRAAAGRFHRVPKNTEATGQTGA